MLKVKYFKSNYFSDLHRLHNKTDRHPQSLFITVFPLLPVVFPILPVFPVFPLLSVLFPLLPVFPVFPLLPVLFPLLPVFLVFLLSTFKQ